LGNTLICVAGLHGNELSGVTAFRSVVQTLRSSEIRLRGEVVGLVGNQRAFGSGKRFIDRDLNRIWAPDLLAQVRGSNGLFENEVAELKELDQEINRVIESASEQIYLLDLHSVSGPGPPFIALDDTLENRKFASAFPMPVVLGLEEELVGTLAGYLTRQGITCVGFEAGQHDDPEAVLNAEAAIWIALEASGVLPRGERHEEVERARRRLSEVSKSLPKFLEIRYRHAVSASDQFKMIPGFSSFQSVSIGQTLARSGAGVVRAPETGFVLMPLYQEQGDDGFFVARKVKALWLHVSAIMRRLGFGRIMHLLPGIAPHPEIRGSFIIDLHKARWRARGVFHLLGFCRTQADDGYLVMSPRSPVSE
jgi:succinylglutamate desuccinylase